MSTPRTRNKKQNRISYAAASSEVAAAGAATAFFLGVAAFLVVAFLVAAAFFAGVGLAGPLVIRPDLVLPRTFSWSTTAGACSEKVSNQNNDFYRMITYARRGLALAGSVCLGFGYGGFLCSGCFLGLGGFGRCLLGRSAFLWSGSLNSTVLLESVSQYP